MMHYEENIDEYIYLIKGNHIEHCKEQELLIDNNVIPVLERKDVYVDHDLIAKGISLQKYLGMELLPWERFQFALIGGTFLRRKDLPDDIYYHEIRDIMGRGSGKNGFIDFLALFFLSPYHGVKGYNIDLIANGEDQAATSIADVSKAVRDPIKAEYTRVLRANFKGMAESVRGLKTDSVFRLNTTSTKNKDSKRTGCIIYDEKHQYESTTNMNTLQSGLGKVKWDRIITITTDGHVRGGILDQEKEQNRIILSEYDPNNRILVNWFRIEHKDEWNQIDKIVKAVPSIHYPSFSTLRDVIEREIRKMPETPDYFSEFMAKRCNYPISDPQKAVADWEDIVACTQEIPFEIKPGMACVGGVDYTKTNDFVGVILLFRSNGMYAVKHHSFICRKSIDLPNIKAPVQKWVEQGICEIVEDVEIPPDLIAHWFEENGRQYNLLKIAVDNYRYTLLNAAFKNIGFDAFPDNKEEKNIWIVNRNDIIKNAPVVMSIFRNRGFSGFDRMLCWYTNNTKAVTDPKGNTAFEKIDPRTRKTDGFMALVHAVCIAGELPDDAAVPDIQMGVFTY